MNSIALAIRIIFQTRAVLITLVMPNHGDTSIHCYLCRCERGRYAYSLRRTPYHLFLFHPCWQPVSRSVFAQLSVCRGSVLVVQSCQCGQCNWKPLFYGKIMKALPKLYSLLSNRHPECTLPCQTHPFVLITSSKDLSSTFSDQISPRSAFVVAFLLLENWLETWSSTSAEPSTSRLVVTVVLMSLK